MPPPRQYVYSFLKVFPREGLPSRTSEYLVCIDLTCRPVTSARVKTEVSMKAVPCVSEHELPEVMTTDVNVVLDTNKNDIWQARKEIWRFSLEMSASLLTHRSVDFFIQILFTKKGERV